MSLARRTFLSSASAAGAGVLAARQPAPSPGFTAQGLHPDFQTLTAGLEYYFLGNGRLIAAIQSVPAGSSQTQAGIVLMSSEHFGRKYDSLLYTGGGLRNTRLTISLPEGNFVPPPATSISWSYPESIPTVRIEWQAGPLEVVEELFCAADEAALFRLVTVRNRGAATVSPQLIATLSPNSGHLDEYEVDRQHGTLTAIGYARVSLFRDGGASAALDRSLTIGLGPLAPGASAQCTLVLTLDWPRDAFERQGYASIRQATAAAWRERTSLRTGNADLDHLFRAASSGVRAAVAVSGKMDGGIWQYNNEWARDTVMVAMGGCVAGHFDLARAILERNLRRIAPDGGTVEASRHREAADMELDQNGELLTAVWTHWVWSGDDSLIRQYAKTLRLVADHVLLPVYLDPDSGLVHNLRELWERGDRHGVKDGYEISYQAWNIQGLEKAAQMALHTGDSASARRWSEAAAKMKHSMLHHPRLALVDDGHLIKRRLLDGSVQRTFVPPHPESLSRVMPLGNEPVSYCDPDTSDVFPIFMDQVDPRGELAARTLAYVEKLWNQRWNTGGYGRYDVTSEPDSPGAWPFATLFVARAYASARNHEKVWRALRWLRQAPGGTGGAWYEFYGPRDASTHFYTGIIPWTWGEMLMLYVDHFLGVRPSPVGVVIRPWLLEGIDRMQASLRVNGHRLELEVERTAGASMAEADGRSIELRDGAVKLPRLVSDTRVVLKLGRD